MRVPRFRLRPTPSGVVVTVLLVAFLIVAPEVADPSMAGFVWAAGLGALVLGLVWPCVAVLTVSVTGAVPRPHGFGRHRRTGERLEVEVLVRPRMSEVSLLWVDAPTGDAVPVPPGGALSVAVPMEPVRRGRFDRLSLVVRSDVPFGLWRASRVVTVDLDGPLVIGPAVIDAADAPDLPIGSVGEVATTAVGHGGDTTRSVRPYVTGDPAHLVHWPTTARTGTIVVREMEPPADRAVAVVLDLGPDPVVASDPGSGLPVMPTTPLAPAEVPGEQAVAKAAAIVDRLRLSGVRVLLATAEPAPQCAEVGSEIDVDARLASASPGTPGAVPPGWPVIHVGPGEPVDLSSPSFQSASSRSSNPASSNPADSGPAITNPSDSGGPGIGGTRG